MEEKDLLQEWLRIFEKEKEIYIFGAAKGAKWMYDFAEKTVAKEKIKGFMVSDISKNPKEMCGLTVYGAESSIDRRAAILVPQNGVYKIQICNLLKDLGYTNVIIATDFSRLYRRKEKELICDEEMIRANDEIQTLVSIRSGNKERDKEICEMIHKELIKGKPDFGHFQPYQSMEIIGLDGERPTFYRIYKYGLKALLRKNSKVLDIGCNTGFMDLMLASQVESITGIEYDATLVNIADMVKDYLGIKNCSFINSDFSKWIIDNVKCYDVIFSFAIHHWIDMNAAEYVNCLCSLLNENGRIIFESHGKGTDEKYELCCECFEQKGLFILKDGTIKDDGIIEREFRIYGK